jgi:energy-coupling factor transport system ATP-binding protein
VDRPGAVGLGRPGGTAIVFQRPEAQVLGVQVRDDVIWGLPHPHDVDIDSVLDRVGLLPLADRETSTLSGGELQRLAVAAALARAPRLLVSDESTAMVDAEGRAQLIALLRDLVDHDGLGVVHVTHHPDEAAGADRVVTLAHGAVVEAPRPSRVTGLHVARARRPDPRQPGAIELRGVGHIYSRDTPWANRALTGIDLTLRRGESLLVVGHNGSGKSTLAWILAGLLVPSEGTTELGGIPIAHQIGRVGLSFQHARLQLLRPTVLDEIKTAAGVDDRTAFDALAGVGLAQVGIAGRRIDELSGGQLRRVVLAGVLASEPVAVVLDEPFAGLDAEGRDELDRLLTRLRNEHDIALVIVSHDYDLPEGLVDRVVELRDGRVVRDEPMGDLSAEEGRQ